MILAKSNRNFEKQLVILLTVYVLANFMILFQNNVIWDDWTIYNMPDVGIMQQFIGNGNPYFGYMHIFLINLTNNPILIYKSLIFIFGLVNVLLFYNILKEFTLNRNTIFIIIILFASFPLGISRSTIICFPYIIGLTLQFVSVLLFIKSVKKRNWIIILFYMIFQFLSCFFLQSSFFLMIGIIFLMAYFKTKDLFNFNLEYFKKYLLQLLKWSVYFLPLIVFFFYRELYMQPTGLYALRNYNTINTNSIIFLPYNLIQTIRNIFDFFNLQLYVVLINLYFLLLFICYMYMYRLIFKKTISNTYIEKNDRELIITFFTILFFGSIAYLLVRKVPVFDSTSDRFSIFLPVALCIGITGIFETVFKDSIKNIIFVLIASLFLTTSVYQNITLLYLNHKYKAVEIFFEQKPIKEGNIYVTDLTSDNYLFNDPANFYVWSGLYKKATGKQDKIFIYESSDGSDDWYRKEQYSQKDAKLSEIKNEIKVSFKQNISIVDIVKFTIIQYINEKKYKEHLMNSFNFEFSLKK